MQRNQPRQSRLRELISNYPPTTLLITTICGLCYILTVLVDVPLGYVSANPYMSIYQHEFYRVFTSAVFHGGIMHIAMNMMSLQAMGTSLEGLFGTTMFFILNVGFILLSGILYLTTCWLLAYGLGNIEWLMYESVGYSGVLFSLASLESFLSPVANRSIFGLITVPTRLYPWALLVVIQVLMPNISLVGHLAGLIVGLVYSSGHLQWFFPSFHGVKQLENMPFMDRVRNIRGFVPCPDHNPVHHAGADGDARSTLRMGFDAIVQCLLPVWRCARVVLIPLYTTVLAPIVAFGVRIIHGVRGGPDGDGGGGDGGGGGGNGGERARQTNWGGGVLGGGNAAGAGGGAGDVELGQTRGNGNAPTATPLQQQRGTTRASALPRVVARPRGTVRPGTGGRGGTAGPAQGRRAQQHQQQGDTPPHNAAILQQSAPVSHGAGGAPDAAETAAALEAAVEAVQVALAAEAADPTEDDLYDFDDAEGVVLAALGESDGEQPPGGGSDDDDGGDGSDVERQPLLGGNRA